MRTLQKFASNHRRQKGEHQLVHLKRAKICSQQVDCVLKEHSDFTVLCDIPNYLLGAIGVLGRPFF